MRIIQFGGYTLPTDQLEMTESQGASRRGSRQTLGGAGGSYDAYGTGPDPLAEDIISKSFIIDTGSPASLQTAIDDFIGQMMLSQNDWRQGARLLVALLPDGTKRATWAKCVEARVQMEHYHESNGWLPVDCGFARSWPGWFDFEDLLYLGDHLGTFADAATAGWTFGQSVHEESVTTPTRTFTVTNSGQARVMSGFIEFDGAVVNPTVYNLTNKQQFTYTGTLAAGDRLTLDIASYNAKLNGVSGQWANVTLGTAHGQLLPMVLEPGGNSMKIVSATPNFIFRFYFASAW